jgi:polysaccharide biosynthesis/export protein
MNQKTQSTRKFIFIATLAFLLGNPYGFTEPLAYSGRQQGNMKDPQVQDGQLGAIPVGYGNDTQFSPYASFMQAPQYSSGSVQRQYMQSPYGQNPYGAMNPATANAQDPLMNSEVSPYSRYSPYIEVIGEGSDYTLGIDDVVTVIVRNQPDFSGRFVVDPEGNVQYNFVGDIPAEGKTKEELKADIMKRLTRFVRYPEVAVMISEYRSKAVYVFGFVNAPGKYAMKGNKITVKEAVVAAGLPRVDGALDRVYVIRPSDNTESGEPEKKKVNLDKILNKGQSAENFMLEPGDTIVVNQRYFDKFVNNFTRIVGPVFQSAAVYDLAFGGREGGIFTGGND